MLESSSRQKQYCDTKEFYKEGDKICIHDTRRKKGLSLKVQMGWTIYCGQPDLGSNFHQQEY